MGHRSIPSKVFVVLSGRVGITHEPIHCVARGDGGYKLQSKVHCLFRITYLLLSTNRVRDSTTYLLSEGATSVLSPISFQLNGSDII